MPFACRVRKPPDRLTLWLSRGRFEAKPFFHLHIRMASSIVSNLESLRGDSVPRRAYRFLSRRIAVVS